MDRRTDLEVTLAVHPAARAAREFVLWYALGPLVDRYTAPVVHGIEHLHEVEFPVIFAANHASHVDTPLILRSLPARWRRHTVVLAAADYFYRMRLKGLAVSLIVGAIPVQRRGMDKRSSGRINNILQDRWNILIYPEGTRSRNGELGRFRTGAGYLAVAHKVPIVPIYVHGTHRAMPPGSRWPKHSPVEVYIGEPLYPVSGEDHRALTDRLHERMLKMKEEVSGP